MMPSRYTADISAGPTRATWRTGSACAYREITIGDVTAQFERALAAGLCRRGNWTPPRRTCRRASRGTLLMALVQQVTGGWC
jgi:hypothetical protein